MSGNSFSRRIAEAFARANALATDLERARAFPLCIPELALRLQESGKIYYSHPSTLRKGRTMLMGHNPVGKNGGTISQTLETLHQKKGSDYRMEDWRGRGAGVEPLQRRVAALCEFLEVDLEGLFAINLIFFRSRDVTTSGFSSNKEVCWRLHELLIAEVVDPDLIIVFGNSGDSPFSFLLDRFGNGEPIEHYAAGHAQWHARSFKAQILGRTRRVFGLPHLSRYSPKFDSPAIVRLKEYVSQLAPV